MLELVVGGVALLASRFLADIGVLGLTVGVVAGVVLARRHPDTAATVDAVVRRATRRAHVALVQAAEALGENVPDAPGQDHPSA